VARSITLEVSPDEAEKLSLASQEGSIVLALRGVGDESEAKTSGSNKRDLLPVASAKKAPGRPTPQARDTYRVEVIHGSSKKIVEF
jgi:Flp pilus assembly protein CpaB